MKRYLTVLLIMGILLTLLVSGVGATSNHSITINGTNDFESDEDVAGTSGATWYFTWDANNFYFGASNDNIDDNSSTKWVHLYMDTDPHGSNGTTTGIMYNTQQPTLPFNADYHLRWKNNNSYINLQTWNGSSWVDGTQTNIDKSLSGTFIEFKIPRANLGSPDAVKVVAGMINEAAFAESTYYMTPSSNSEGYDANYTHYFGFPLIAGVSPDASCNVDTYPAGTKATGNYNTGSTWTGSSVPPSDNSTNVYVANGHTLTLDADKTVKCLTILSGGTFNGGTGSKTLTIASGGRLKNSGTYTRDTETVSFAGTGTIEGTISLQNLVLSGSVTLSSGVTVNGTLTINANGAVISNTPTYGSSSTLRYNSGGSYNVSTEWGTGTTVGTGVPQNVQVSTSSTSVSLTGGSARTVPGNVTIDANTTLALSGTSGGDLNVGGNWTNNGTFTHNSRTVTFNGGGTSTYGGSSTTTFNNLTVNAGTTLDVGTNTLFGANGTVTNNGTLKQSQTVNANSTVVFLNVSTSKYYGIEIASGGTALGNTTVSVSGNQVCSLANGYPVKRCFGVTPATQSSANIKFYYSQTEMQGGAYSTLNVWNYHSSQWNSVTRGGDSGSCAANAINCYVQGNAITTYSPFALKVTSPQAITLADFSAAQTGDAVLLTWETNSELDNRGFNLYRGVSPGAPDRQLNATLIPSQGPGSPGGFIYTWEDRADLVSGTTYFYWVEDVDMNNVATRHGPVSVDYNAPTALRLLDAGAASARPLALPLMGAGLLALVGALAWRKRRPS